MLCMDYESEIKIYYYLECESNMTQADIYLIKYYSFNYN